MLNLLVKRHGTTIYDKHGQTFDLNDYPTSQTKMLAKFALQESYQKCRNVLTIVHYISSGNPISEMKHNPKICRILIDSKIQFNIHKWDIEQTDLRNLGILMFFNPNHKNKTVVETKIQEYMEWKHHTSLFSLCSSTTSYNSKTVQTSTYSSVYQTLKEEVYSSYAILNIANKDPDCWFKSVSFKDRYENPEQFHCAIDHQTKFNNSQKVIPIVGISESAMKLLFPKGHTLKFNIQNKMHGMTHLIKDIVPAL